MSNPGKLVVNCSTGESYSVDLTPEEIADMEQVAIQESKIREEEIAKAQAKAAAKASAEAKLAALGLTAEEIAAL